MDRLVATKVCAIVSLVLFIVDLLFNAAASVPGPLLGLFFNNNLMSTSSTFVASSITPSSWIFWIWILIYSYQLAWIVFSIILAFTKKTSIVPIGSYVGFM
ncbi:hypothetical protein MXB_4802, partial [Myxobolus squamalis]